MLIGYVFKTRIYRKVVCTMQVVKKYPFLAYEQSHVYTVLIPGVGSPLFIGGDCFEKLLNIGLF